MTRKTVKLKVWTYGVAVGNANYQLPITKSSRGGGERKCRASGGCVLRSKQVIESPPVCFDGGKL